MSDTTDALTDEDRAAVARAIDFAGELRAIWGPLESAALTADMQRLLDIGRWPSDADLAGAPLLDRWHIGPGLDGLSETYGGDVQGHPYLGSQLGITTSAIMIAGPRCARTWSRWYRLGVAAEPGDRDSLRERYRGIFRRPIDIEIGFGWRDLLGRMLADLHALPTRPRIHSIRVSMGQLEVGLWAPLESSETAQRIVAAAITEAAVTCEECGAPGSIAVSDGVARTTCGDH